MLDGANRNPSTDEIFLGLNMTGHFLNMYFSSVSNKNLPLSRNYLIDALRNGAA
jgi:hypothetical protein